MSMYGYKGAYIGVCGYTLHVYYIYRVCGYGYTPVYIWAYRGTRVCVNKTQKNKYTSYSKGYIIYLQNFKMAGKSWTAIEL